MAAVILAVVAALAIVAAAVLARRVATLRASERLYRTLVTGAPDISIVLIDRELDCRLVEGAAIGWSRVALAGALRAELEPFVRAALAGESAHTDWHVDGSHYALLFGPFEEPGRGVTHAICVVRDITAKVDAGLELDQQRDFLTSLLEQMSDRVYACDAEGRLLTFGPDGDGGRGMHPLEWAGAFGLLHPDGSPLGPHEAPLLRALRGERVDGVELLIDRPAGRGARLCSGGPVKAADGRLLGAVITAADLTGRRETEELLRISEERHRRVVETMEDCVFETDAAGRWTFLNAAWTRATGHEVSSSIGREAIHFVHPADRSRHYRAFEPMLRGEQASAQLTHRFSTIDGAARWVDVRVSAVPGWNALPTGFVGVMRDITDEQRARQHAAAENSVVRLLTGAQSFEELAPRLLEALCVDLEWDVAELWRMGQDECLHKTAGWIAPGVDVPMFASSADVLAFEVGDGLPGQAWMSREPLWRADLQADPGFARGPEAAHVGLVSGVGLPLRAEGRPVGVVLLFSLTRRDPEPGLVRPFETIGAHIGQFMQRRDAERRAAEQAADLTAISGVAHALASQNDMYAARTTLVRAVREVTVASLVVLWELGAGGDELEVTASDGAAVRGMTVSLETPSMAQTTFMLGELAYAADIAADERVSDRWRSITGGGSAAWVPVKGEGRVHGVLAVGWDERRPLLPPREAELLRLLAAEAAVTIHRTALLGTLQATARTDALTGLPNRRVWDEDLERELARARRHGGELCLAMLDLDRFKAFNDHHGHQAGDRLLAAAAAAWRPILRSTDTIARYGGEEFAVLLPHSDDDAARAVVERLLEAVPLGQTASAGIAAWDGHESAEALLARADAALYEAKGAGRARAITAR
jgi:diguanylate cyclase (GGDEF)-like protein/PAS domain S-box-containing protein